MTGWIFDEQHHVYRRQRIDPRRVAFADEIETECGSWGMWMRTERMRQNISDGGGSLGTPIYIQAEGGPAAVGTSAPHEHMQ